ncbi:MAG: DUF1295 domain-containing protein [Nitrospiraceae bacterium]
MTMDVNPVVLVLLGWLAAAPLMLVLWFAQRSRPNASLADVGWCFGFAFVIFGYALAAPGEIERRLVVSSLAGIHAIRLGTHILFDRVLGKTEDARYQTLRREWGSRAPLYSFFYFQSQAVAIAVFSIPLLVLMYNPHKTVSLWELAGVVVWLGAVIGETMADRQLARFRANPNNGGKTCRLGLWRYSRHPNYFFEGLYWSAYVLMGVGVPYGWLTLIGPLLMVWALLRVTGVPRAEAQALASRGADYREYQRTTSVFLPWFPKEDKP